MKRLFYLSIILTAASCKREPLTTYNTKDNIYFNYAIGTNHFVDSMDFSFAYSDATVKDTFLLVPLAVTGAPAAGDRSFSITVDPASGAAAGTHYDLPELLIHAGKVQDSVRIRIKRTADLGSGIKKLILHLQPNDFFETGLQFRVLGNAARDTADMLSFSILLSDILAAGPYWDLNYAQFFGKFSLKKVRFIHELVGMPLDFWSIAELTNQRRASAIYYASTTARYLSEQAAQGNTIYDEDGTPMKMGPSYQ